MDIPTVNVTCDFSFPSGRIINNGILVVQLAKTEKYNGYIIPQEVRVVIKENHAVVSIFPNELGTESSWYDFIILDDYDVVDRIETVVVPNADCNLWEIVELDPYPLRNAGDIITAAQIAQIEDATSGCMFQTIFNPRGLKGDVFDIENITGIIDGGTFN